MTTPDEQQLIEEIDEDLGTVHISIQGEELTFTKAAKQLRVMADMVEAQMMSAAGFNWDYGGEYMMLLAPPSQYPHGDYQDSEGNLVHVGEDDHIINVIWAGKNAEPEALADQDLSVFDWIRDHGPLTRAGSDTAGHEHPEHD